MLLRFAHSNGAIQLAEAEGTRATKRARIGRASDELDRLPVLLHSTLDLDELFRLFAREAERAVGTASLRYVNESRELRIAHGRPARHAKTAALVIDDHALGSITLTRVAPFSAQDEERIGRSLAALALPLRHALLYRDAVQASITDALTGVHNRKVLETTLRREAGLSHRHGTPLSLVMLDIDDFKSINDEHGHAAGDAVLRSVAAALAECVRRTDVLARFGGDEFAILLSNTQLAGAIAAARHVLARVTGASCRAAGTILRVSPSIGVAALRRRDGHRRLFERADAALYAAKDAGGGRIAVASGSRSRLVV